MHCTTTENRYAFHMLFVCMHSVSDCGRNVHKYMYPLSMLGMVTIMTALPLSAKNALLLSSLCKTAYILHTDMEIQLYGTQNDHIASSARVSCNCQCTKSSLGKLVIAK